MVVRTIVDLLVRGQYEAIERITAGNFMTADEMHEAVVEYGRTLTRPGPGWWQLVQLTPVTVEPGKLYVAAPLWTEEEGRSDLSMELWLTEFTPGLYRPSVLTIHVL